MTELWYALSTTSLAVVVLACYLHLNANVDRHTAHCERWGFILTGAGAFGEAIYPWWPRIENLHLDALMHVGMALIAIALVRGRIRTLLIGAGVRWAERRRVGSVGGV